MIDRSADFTQMTNRISVLRNLQTSRVDLRQLDYFIQIAQAASLSKAAAQLQVSHSMLSRGIQELEMALGHRLFHRTGRGMQLTDFGRDLLPRAQRAATEVTRFADEAKALRGKLSGTVAIGLPGSIAMRLVTPLVRMAREQYPELFLRFVEALSGGVEEMLATRRIDVGLVFARDARTGRGDIPLALSRLYLVGPAGDALTSKRSVTLAQAAQCPLMMPNRPHSVRAMLDDACAKANLAIHLPCEIDSLLAIKEAVVMGCGYTVSGYDGVARDVAAGRLQAALIKDPPLARLLVVGLGSKQSVTTAARAVADLISAIAAKLTSEGEWRAPGPGLRGQSGH